METSGKFQYVLHIMHVVQLVRLDVCVHACLPVYLAPEDSSKVEAGEG